MLELDHVAITVFDLEKSIHFYQKLGYQLQNQFNDEEYRWATLELSGSRLEIFEPSKKELPKINHIAYSYTDEKEVFQMVKQLSNKEEESMDIFYGDLNRKSFFIDDNSGLSIQFIKKKTD
ncbi:MAG: VOC family protein [Bacilli bacterium]|nr:VOC family protein [Bacilli bacterium]